MRWGRLVTVAALTLLAGVACDTEDQYVMLAVVVPAGVEFERIRLAKVVDDRDAGALERNQQADASVEFTGMVRVSLEKGSRVKVAAEAIRGQSVVAWGETPIDEPGQVTLRLEPCRAGVMAGHGADCAMPPRQTAPDGGRDAGPEPGRDAGAEPAPMCEDPDAGVAVPFVAPMTTTPGCRRYCMAMEKNCPSAFGDATSCLYACERLAWPVGTTEGPGNTLLCRTGWAEHPPTSPPQALEICDRASPRSEGACGTGCVVYCTMGETVCPDHFPSDCIELCEKTATRYKINQYPLVACRAELLERAIFDRRLCSWAGPANSCGECRPIERE